MLTGPAAGSHRSGINTISHFDAIVGPHTCGRSPEIGLAHQAVDARWHGPAVRHQVQPDPGRRNPPEGIDTVASAQIVTPIRAQRVSMAPGPSTGRKQ